MYNYRVFDRYDREVISLAILADDDPSWRPKQFRYGRWGFKAGITFPIVKLLDYASRAAELESDPNPFATVELAHLKALETRQAPEDRRSLEGASDQGAVRAGLECRRRAALVSLHRLDHGIAVRP